MSAHHGRPKRRRPKRSRQHPGPGSGIALASACDACAHLIGNPEPSEHGLRMTMIHASHIPELEAEGWVTTPAPDGGPPDCTCIHYHLQHWEGGHGDDCCGLG
jgi:hypothetical protein